MKSEVMEVNEENLFGEVIFEYTRAQALEDGVLVDVTEMAKEAGIKYPTAVTRAVWDTYIEPDESLKQYGQSASGRLWDALYMFAIEARKTAGSELLYKLYFLMPDKGSVLVTLKAVCGPSDDGSPCITVMLPDED